MKKIGLIIIIIFLLLAVAYLYLEANSQKKYPIEYGISFNRQHAEYLGLAWKKVYLDMLDELKPKYIRIAAAWNEVEQEHGKFNNTEVDWQMQEARKRGVKIVLTIGQKSPRWPECRVPDWAKKLNKEEYKTALLDYVKQVVEKYQNNPALEIWQVENEPFIKFRFGECVGFREDLVKEEIALVHQFDNRHQVMITDSGELSTWRKSSHAGDLFGTTLYRIVRTPSGRIWNYDWLPSAFYRLKAEFWKINPNKMFVSELQAEPWFMNSDPNKTSIVEQEKTMNSERLQKHFDYVERIGISRAYLWGVEWWYWMKEKQNDARYWEIVKRKLGN